MDDMKAVSFNQDQNTNPENSAGTSTERHSTGTWAHPANSERHPINLPSDEADSLTKFNEYYQLVQAGELSVVKACELLKISKRTYYRRVEDLRYQNIGAPSQNIGAPSQNDVPSYQNETEQSLSIGAEEYNTENNAEHIKVSYSCCTGHRICEPNVLYYTRKR